MPHALTSSYEGDSVGGISPLPEILPNIFLIQTYLPTVPLPQGIYSSCQSKYEKRILPLLVFGFESYDLDLSSNLFRKDLYGQFF